MFLWGNLLMNKNKLKNTAQMHLFSIPKKNTHSWREKVVYIKKNKIEMIKAYQLLLF